MANRIVQTDYAPAAIGPYSQGAFTQIALYCSGQLGIDPATGKLADGIEEQATQAFKNLRAVITEAGFGGKSSGTSPGKPVSRWPISSK